MEFCGQLQDLAALLLEGVSVTALIGARLSTRNGLDALENMKILVLVGN